MLSTAPAPRSIMPGSAAWVSSISASELRTTSSLSRPIGQVWKTPAGAEAGAVAQTGYRFAAKPLCQLPPARGLAQVERHNVDPYRVLRAQLAGEVIQAFLTAGDQHQRVAAPGQTAGQLGADARGGTRNDDG